MSDLVRVNINIPGTLRARLERTKREVVCRRCGGTHKAGVNISQVCTDALVKAVEAEEKHMEQEEASRAKRV